MRVLLVVPPERTDWYDYLAAAPDIDWLLLWHEKPSQVCVDLDRLPIRFHEHLFWRDYRSPATLLAAAKVDKIIFFEIIDLRQIALNVAARAIGVTTFFLEHGAAGDRAASVERWKETSFLRQKLPYLVRRATHSLSDAISAKAFYYRQTRGFASLRSRLSYLLLPAKMLGFGPNEALARTIFRERVPKWSIVFSENNFEYYQVYTGIAPSEALFTGLPFYDSYNCSEPVEQDHVVFIDHSYLEEALLGWTPQHHRRVATALYDFAKRTGRKVFVKLHPRSHRKTWLRYGFDPAHLEVVQFGEFDKLYLTSRLIIGFSSSLLTGFLSARKNVVVVGWHPRPGIFGVDFAATGLCHRSLDIEDLKTRATQWLSENKSQDDTLHKAFLRRYNYPFDGRAGERVLEAIRKL